MIRAGALDDADPTGLSAGPLGELRGGESLAALLDDYSPTAIEDLAELPLPAGGLWDATFPPIPAPPPAPIHWRVFFQNDDDRQVAATAIAAAFPRLNLTHVDIEDEDWETNP